MQLKITAKIWKIVAKESKSAELADSLTWRSDHDPVEKDTDELTAAQFDILEKALNDNATLPGSEHALRSIAAFRSIQKDPQGRKIGRLSDLEQALRVWINKNSPNKWLFEDVGDYLLAWYVTEISYSPAEKDSPAIVQMKMSAISRGSKVGRYLSWHMEDLREKKTVVEMLRDLGFFTPTPAAMRFYEMSLEKYKLHQPQTGEQFIASGSGDHIEDNYRSRISSLVRDGVPFKLVMDDKSGEGREFGKDSGMDPGLYWITADNRETAERTALPVHPYVKLFDLDNHQFIIVHIDQLEPYQWTPEIGDKLILPEEHKQVIDILMSTAAEEIDDIIKGKSGGTIVISTGIPGTGKTLTAEITSEVIKRPLYKVNCSQLGTDEEAIEEELNLVLNRSQRWKALLLIDEADVYVRSRGTDIQQNAIVGVFLRVLEYYRGVLFLTSNMETVIDDAIMSRATVHLKYYKPTEEALFQIWFTLSKQFGLEFGGDFIHKLVATFPGIVGRDVKNLLKLVIRYNKKVGGKITLDAFKMLAIHKDIKVKE